MYIRNVDPLDNGRPGHPRDYFDYTTPFNDGSMDYFGSGLMGSETGDTNLSPVMNSALGVDLGPPTDMSSSSNHGNGMSGGGLPLTAVDIHAVPLAPTVFGSTVAQEAGKSTPATRRRATKQLRQRPTITKISSTKAQPVKRRK